MTGIQRTKRRFISRMCEIIRFSRCDRDVDVTESGDVVFLRGIRMQVTRDCTVSIFLSLARAFICAGFSYIFKHVLTERYCTVHRSESARPDSASRCAGRLPGGRMVSPVFSLLFRNSGRFFFWNPRRCSRVHWSCTIKILFLGPVSWTEAVLPPASVTALIL